MTGLGRVFLGDELHPGEATDIDGDFSRLGELAGERTGSAELSTWGDLMGPEALEDVRLAS